MFEKISGILSFLTMIAACVYLIYLIFVGVCMTKRYFASETDYKLRLAITSFLLVMYIARIVISVVNTGTVDWSIILLVVLWGANVFINISGLIKEKKRKKALEAFKNIESIEGFSKLQELEEE